MIKNIVFDFGGVLVQHDFIAYFSDYFHSEEKARQFFAQALPHSFSDEVDRALHPFHYYIERQQRQWPEYDDVPPQRKSFGRCRHGFDIARYLPRHVP